MRVVKILIKAVTLMFFFHKNLLASFTPVNWGDLIAIQEKHDFLLPHKSFEATPDTWQTLFSLKSYNDQLQILKDCIYYKVPGKKKGKLLILSINKNMSCNDFLFKNISSNKFLSSSKKKIVFTHLVDLQFSLNQKKLVLNLHFSNFSTVKIEGHFIPKMNLEKNLLKKPQFLSSTSFSKQSVVLVTRKKVHHEIRKLENGVLCHDVSSDCKEKSLHRCYQCQNGFIEIPNGCLNAPKVCGEMECGQKNSPACPRGLSWNQANVPTDCRIDHSFAFCEEGLQVTCEGEKAYCR